MAFTIGQLAKELDINVETIRYYEKRGLIERPRKESVGYRTYSRELLNRIRFIIGAKSLGFTLKEIGLGLTQIQESSAICDFVSELLDLKTESLTNQIRLLENQLKEIEALKTHCREHFPQEKCVVDDRLKRDGGGNPT